MQHNEFKAYHPLVNFIYFICVIGFSCVLLHPFCLLISFVLACSFSILLKGGKARKNLLYLLPTVLLLALLNPLFNHRGATVLAYFPNGNPLTLESVFYGVAAAMMVACVVLWFSCCTEVMTSDKIMYLFGKVLPSLSLVFSMTLRFVPRFIKKLKQVIDAQKTIGQSITHDNLLRRGKHAFSVLSVVITWALENSIDTADSLKARGFGLSGRTFFSLFTFKKRDVCALVVMLFLGAYTLYGCILGAVSFTYFPFMQGTKLSLFSVSVYVAYFVLLSYPLLVELREVIRWNVIKSKM